MPQSLVQIYLHLVFSTKNRQPFLQDMELRTKMLAYLAGACKNLKSPPIIVGGVEDHVHILCRLAKTIPVSDFLREIKRESSKWIKKHESELSCFGWQDGYGAFSISPAHVGVTRDYIANQEEHHRNVSFQDEFRRLLKKYDIEYDERYVWD